MHTLFYNFLNLSLKNKANFIINFNASQHLQFKVYKSKRKTLLECKSIKCTH